MSKRARLGYIRAKFFGANMSIIRLSIAVVTKAQFDRITEKAAQKDALPTVLSSKAITFRCKLNATDDQNIEGVEKQVLSIYESVSRAKGSSAGLFDKTFSYLQRDESVKFSAEPNNFLYLVLEKGPQPAATKKRAGPNSSPNTPKSNGTQAQSKRQRKEAAKAAKFASGSPAPSTPNRVSRRKEEFGSPNSRESKSPKPKVPAKSPETKAAEEKTPETKAELPVHTNFSGAEKSLNTKREQESSSASSAEPAADTPDSKITNESDDSDSDTSSDDSMDESDSDDDDSDDDSESEDDETDDEKLRRRQRAERAKLLSASRRSSSTEPQELLSTQAVPSKPAAAKPAPKKPAPPKSAPPKAPPQSAPETEDNPETGDHVPGLGGFEKLSKFHPDVHDSKPRPAPKPPTVDAESSDAESEDSSDSSDSSDDDSSSEDEKTAKSTPRKKKLKHLFN